MIAILTEPYMQNFFFPVAIYNSWNHWTCYESGVPLVYSMFNVGNVRYSMDAFNIYAPLFWSSLKQAFQPFLNFLPIQQNCIYVFLQQILLLMLLSNSKFPHSLALYATKIKKNVIKPKKNE